MLRLVPVEAPDGDAPGDAALTLVLAEAPVTLTVGELAVVTCGFPDAGLAVFLVAFTGGELAVVTCVFSDAGLAVLLVEGELAVVAYGFSDAGLAMLPVAFTVGELAVVVYGFINRGLVVFPVAFQQSEKFDAEAVSLEAERMMLKLPDLPVAVVILEEHLIVSQVMLAVPLDLY